MSELRASEIVVIDQVIQNMGNWSTNALDRFIRSDMPWVATKEGEIMNYKLALYREPPYAVRNYDLEEEASPIWRYPNSLKILKDLKKRYPSIIEDLKVI